MRTFKVPPPDDMPEDTVCVVFNVPNSLQWLTALWTVMDGYNYWFNWESTTDKRATLVATRWRQMFWEAHEIYGQGGDCPVPFDVRQNDENACSLEKTEDGETWIEFADLQLCPPHIRRNEGKLQWWNGTSWVDLPEQGDEKFDGEADPPFPDPPPGEDGACLAAENLTALLTQQVVDWTAALTAGAIALGIVTIITGVLSAFFIPFATPAILGFATTIIGIGATGLENAFTEEVYDRFKCILNCHVSSDGAWTTEEYNDALDEIEAETGVAWDLIETWFQFFGPVGLTRSGAAAGILEGDCECDCVWCYHFDFTTGTHGFTIVSGEGGAYSPGVGFVGTFYNENSQSLIVLERVFDSTLIKSIKTVYDIDACSGVNCVVQIRDYTGAPAVLENCSTTSGTDKECEWIGSETMTTVRLVLNSGDSNGHVVLKSVRFTGVGTNPFGTDNC